jgi:predicted anti-sigma-YlaC factor YlaD
MGPLRDYYGMDCNVARDAISALLDGESSAAETSALEAHLADCQPCSAWREHAHDVTRRVRLASAARVPSVREDVLVALGAAERCPRWWRSQALMRAALAAVGVGQLIFTVQPLLFGVDHQAPMHVAHELGAFDMALAVGFLVAAWRPARAPGMRALVGCAAALLVATAAIDLVAGRTSVGDELPHLLAVAGWLLIRRISVLSSDTADEPTATLLSFVSSKRRVARLPAENRRLGAVAQQAQMADGGGREHGEHAAYVTPEPAQAARTGSGRG